MSDPFSPRRIWVVKLDGDESYRVDPDIAERLARVLDLSPGLPFVEIQTDSGSVRFSRRFPEGNDELIERHLQVILHGAPWIGSITLPATDELPRRIASAGEEPVMPGTCRHCCGGPASANRTGRG